MLSIKLSQLADAVYKLCIAEIWCLDGTNFINPDP